MNRRPLVLALVMILSSCDGSPGDDGPGNAGPYVIATRVWDDSATTSYFHVVPSLEEGTQIDTSRALEVPGSARLYAHAGGWFAVGSGESPTITRYSLDDEGRFVEEAALSLQPYGVIDLWDTIYFVSDDVAYYPDRAGSQLIVWSPSTMEVTGTIALPETVREGYLSLYSYAAVARGDALLFSVGWFDWENDRVLPETGLVVIDTTTHSASRVDVDTRCAGITQAIPVASGDVYFVSSALAGAAHRIERLTTAPCALRVRASADAFDPTYLRSLDTLSEGAIAGEPVPGGGSSIFLRVLDESLVTIDPTGASWDVTGQAAWRWARWNVEDDSFTPIDALEPSTADVVWLEIDGRVFGTETTPDYATTTLIELTAEGGPRRALTAPGFLHAAARVR
ncbi:hypothetical protein [Sandaracinus amylolyticus]|uniref:hypothetical protein n=1 Tax=Sandaracinus amylolyticus TaxID=927083 RepID=UPI001F447B16|nr:hypothetical protein [Sandaracinus amylolyticus]